MRLSFIIIFILNLFYLNGAMFNNNNTRSSRFLSGEAFYLNNDFFVFRGKK